MKKDQFEILMYALYGNNQLFIPQGQTIQEWIDNAFDNAIKQGQTLPIDSFIVPKGTLCISCQKEPATNGIGNRKTLCSKCWNKIAG